MQSIKLGGDHPKTISSMQGLSNALHKQGNHVENKDLLESILKLQVSRPDTNPKEIFKTRNSLKI